MAQQREAAASVAALASVCVATFAAQPDAATKLTEFKKVPSAWDRQSFIEKGGRATLFGSDKPNSDVATGCAQTPGKPAYAVGIALYQAILAGGKVGGCTMTAAIASTR